MGIFLHSVKMWTLSETSVVMLGKICETATPRNKLVKKDHITCIDGETDRYIDHYTPKTGTGKNIAIGFCNIVGETDSQDSLRALGCGMHDFVPYLTVGLVC